ncbi:hypothetical protein OJF2_21660 [Aquisphaera giovannonii]|uniref:DUF2029 domain-containing protein n=1 Tax=Aquisphaera giovannonii TaxID=406548 RepID=A0A5B9W137_9BACT|nr:glycosyltransferase 87 family protein [Aquisphaera giovannonii]QEH33660.1 hypothetical protein OJF2_21660 [Aquisphaera giovannonii]
MILAEGTRPSHGAASRERPLRKMAIAYGVAAAAWLVLARWPGRSLALAVNRGAAPDWVRHLMLGFPPPAYGEETLAVWGEKAIAVAVALVLHLGLVVWLRRRPGRDVDDDGAWRAMIGRFAIVFLIYTAAVGPVQDYTFYLIMWKETWLGHDPWFLTSTVFGLHPLNAYGPLFNLLAALWAIDRFFPKLVFASAYVGFAAWVMESRRGPRPGSAAGRLMLMAWLGNPYVWVEIPHYGHFEVLVGVLCVAAVRARIRDQDVKAGTCLALGTLIKYLPVFLVPFVSLDRPRHRWRLIAWAYGLTAIGLGVSTVIWGRSTFRPILFAVERSPHHLSIYRFLNGVYSPLEYLSIRERPSDWAPAILVIALGSALAWCERRRVAPLPAGVLAMVITALLYQTGFAQYHMVAFILSTVWAAVDPPEAWRRRVLIAAMVPYFGWLAGFDVFTACFEFDRYNFQEWAGLVTFLLGSLLIAAIAVAATGPARSREPGPSLEGEHQPGRA